MWRSIDHWVQGSDSPFHRHPRSVEGLQEKAWRELRARVVVGRFGAVAILLVCLAIWACWDQIMALGPLFPEPEYPAWWPK